MSWETVAAYIGVIGILVYPVAAIALHAVAPGTNPLRSSLSDYASGRGGFLMTVGLLALGLGAGVLDAALAAGLGAGKRVAVGIVFIALFALGRIGAAIFPGDLADGPRSARGGAHGALNVVAFTAIAIATIAITPVFNRVQRWKGIAPGMGWLELAVVVFAFLLLVTLIRPLRAAFGLVERLFAVSVIAWLVVTGLHFAQLPR